MKKFFVAVLSLLLAFVLPMGLFGCEEETAVPPPSYSHPDPPEYILFESYEEYMTFFAANKPSFTFVGYEEIAMIGEFHSFYAAYGIYGQYNDYWYKLTDSTDKQVIFGITTEENWKSMLPTCEKRDQGGEQEPLNAAVKGDFYVEQNDIYYEYGEGILREVYWKCRDYYMYLHLPADYPAKESDTFIAGIFRSTEEAEQTLWYIDDVLPWVSLDGQPNVNGNIIYCSGDKEYNEFIEANPSLPFYFLTYEQLSMIGRWDRYLVIYSDALVHEYDNVAFHKYEYTMNECKFTLEYFGQELLPDGTLPPTDVKPLPPRHFIGGDDLYFTFGIPQEPGAIEINGVRYHYGTKGYLTGIEWSYRGIALSISLLPGRYSVDMTSFVRTLLHNQALTEEVLSTFNRRVLDPIFPEE